MKKKFITYGSNTFIQSAKRIIEEAKSLNIFDETQSYGYSDLPYALKSSPLFLDKKKGGYWIWKAYVILDSLSKLNNGDILVYADSGCELKNTSGWTSYFDKLNTAEAIFFQYRTDKNYGWSAFNPSFIDSPKLKYWVKKMTVDYFRPAFENDEEWLEKNKLIAGFSFIKKTPATMQMIKDWLEIMIYMPQLVTDPLIFERKDQTEGFSAHRHDQSILSIIVRSYEQKINIQILNETCEGEYPDQILKASRRVDKLNENKIKSVIKRFFTK